MEAVRRFSSWQTLLLVGIIYLLLPNEVFSNNSTIHYPPDYAMQPCELSNSKEGVCVYSYLCRDNVLNIDGSAIIDLRFLDVCEDYFLKCCSKETPCLENTGTCVSASNCGANLNDLKYKQFTETKECDWSGYKCCPNDKIGKSEVINISESEETAAPTPANDEVDTTEQYEICDEHSMCVSEDQCLVKPDGENFIQARISICSGTNEICCPRDKMMDKDPCNEVGGTCIPESSCPDASSLILDIRISQCDENGHVCCMQDATEGRDQFINKTCFGGSGKCTARKECKGTTYKDKTNECGGLACCATLPTPSSSTSTTSRPDSPTTSAIYFNTTPPKYETSTTTPRTTTSPDGVEGKVCNNRKGICMTGSCLGKTYNDANDDCEGLNCCADIKEPVSASPPTHPVPSCNSVGGKCISNEDCNQQSEVSVGDCKHDEVCCEVINGCGYRNEKGIKFSAIGGADGESQFGEFPWMVAIMAKENGKVRFICGGSLIDTQVVLTSAECVRSHKRSPEKLIVRAGEWDIGTIREPIPHEERSVINIKSHPDFKATTLVNNIALLFLEDRFDLTLTINTVCLPPQDFKIDNGEVTASGWGSTPQNPTKKQQIIKSIDLQYVEQSECERALRRATRNPSFKLHPSFICAGGTAGVDTCGGDAGSPIVYQVPDESKPRYYAVGMVSWGVGCGKYGVPAAYTDIAFFRTWIDKEMEKAGLESYYYTYTMPDNDNGGDEQ